MDTECAEDSICEEGACVVEEALCASSAECEERRFCVPRNDMDGSKTICDRVVRCDEVDSSDVSALCSQNNSLEVVEEFICDVSNPATPTCTRPPEPEPVQCESSTDCMEEGEYCLTAERPSGPQLCGVPDTCKNVLEDDQSSFCTDQKGGKQATCQLAIPGRHICRVAATE